MSHIFVYRQRVMRLCRGAGRQRYAGGRADSVMPGGGPTALCPDSVMPSQRYALPRLGVFAQNNNLSQK